MLLFFVSSLQQHFTYIDIKFKVKLIYKVVMLKLMLIEMHLRVYIVRVLTLAFPKDCCTCPVDPVERGL